ncbi:MAG: hypothetical protein AAF561_05450 [Planctomycetota bacterium]
MPRKQQNDRQQRATPTVPLPPGQWVTADEKAALIGVSVNAIRRWCRRYGARRRDAIRVPVYRNNRRWFVRLGIELHELRCRGHRPSRRRPSDFDAWLALPLATRLEAWKRLGAAVDWGNLRAATKHGRVRSSADDFLADLKRRGMPASRSSLYGWNRVFWQHPWPYRLFELVDLRRVRAETDV